MKFTARAHIAGKGNPEMQDGQVDPADGEYMRLLAEDLAGSTYFRNRGADPQARAAADLERGRAFAEALSRVVPVQGRRVLEIGCGDGSIAVALAQAEALVIPTDYSWGRMRRTRARFLDHRLTGLLAVADGTELPVRSGSIDLVVCHNVLEHVPDPERMLSEISRVLRPAGLCCLSAPNRQGLLQILRDEHYGLPLLVLLPRPVARTIVTKLARRDVHYLVQRVPSYRWLERTCMQFGLEVRAVMQPDLGLIRGKILEPTTVTDGRIRQCLTVVRRLGIAGPLARLATSRFALCFVYGHFSVLLAKKST